MVDHAIAVLSKKPDCASMYTAFQVLYITLCVEWTVRSIGIYEVKSVSRINVKIQVKKRNYFKLALFLI